MKRLLFPLLLISVMALSISPTHVRMEMGDNETFEITMYGEGQVHDLEIFGPYLSWQTKRVWVGPRGKTEYVVFSPLDTGEFSISANFNGEIAESTIEVFNSKEIELFQRIQELREETNDPEILVRLDEAERLYNESRIQLAEFEVNEIEALNLEKDGNKFNISQPVLLLILVILAGVLVKFLLG